MSARFPPEEMFGKRLSPREQECLTLMADGMSNAEIGSLLDLSTNTIKVYVASLLAKLGAANRTHAITVAHQQKLLVPIVPPEGK